MKKLFFTIVAIMVFISPAFTKELTLTFTTTSISGAKYSPRHILAVWVKNSSGQYQRTLIVYAKERKGYLYKWQSISGGDNTDAITGATLSSPQSHSVTWDLTNYAGQALPDGEYTLCMEITSYDGQGPYREISFTVGNDSYELTPSDGSNFIDISLNYDSGIIVSSSGIFDVGNYLKVFPNPAKGRIMADVVLEKDSKTDIRIINSRKQIIAHKKLTLKQGNNNVDLGVDAGSLPQGLYLVIITTDHYVIGEKLLIE